MQLDSCVDLFEILQVLRGILRSMIEIVAARCIRLPNAECSGIRGSTYTCNNNTCYDKAFTRVSYSNTKFAYLKMHKRDIINNT